MNCLKGYIGVKGCGQATPAGGYINMLPGISLRSIHGIANSEQETFVRVWEDVQDRAWMRFESDFKSKLRAKFNLRTILGNYDLRSIDSGSVSEAKAQYAGIVIDSGINENGLFAFDVFSISYDSTFAGEITFKVFDRQGVELDSIVKTVAAGLNSFSIEKRYTASLIFIAVDCSLHTSKYTTVTEDKDVFYNYLYNAFNGCCQPLVSGATTSLGNRIQHAFTGSTFGLSAMVTPTCDFTTLICRNKDQYRYAWMNLLGAEIMIETLHSERKNAFTMIGADAAEQLRDVFTAQYENALEEAVKGIRINNNDDCIECAKRITYVETLP